VVVGVVVVVVIGAADIVSTGQVCVTTVPLIHGTMTPFWRFSSFNICCMIWSFVVSVDQVLSVIVSDNFSNRPHVESEETIFPDPFAS